MKIPFSPDQILERMQFENPWWNSGGIEEYYSQLTRRAYYLRLFSLMQDRSVQRAVVLMGPRRVGKTVLLFHCIQGLIEQGINPQKICYISVETPIYNGISLEELLQFYLTASGHSADSELFLIFDEIQYLKNWELHLKSLVDSYKKIKFIVSGSAAAALKLKSTESGAGRFTDFVLPPLTFQEYLQLKKIDISITEDTDRSSGYEEQLFYTTNDIKRLNQHFIDYINFGGYPEVSLSTTIQSDPGRYIRNDIIDKVLLRDLPLLYGIEDIQELNSLFTYIAYNTGCEMSLESIASSSGVSKNTIKKYISYLEAAFLITIVNRVDQTGKKFKRANFFKIYLTNPSLRCALFSPIKDGDPLMGNLVETAIFSQWQHSIYPLFYARWQNGEVDIVYLDNEQKPKWIVEIKWSNKSISDNNQLRNLIHFGLLHDMKSATITTVDVSARNEISGLLFDFIPSSLYCYTVGKNLILYKNPLGKSITPV